MAKRKSKKIKKFKRKRKPKSLEYYINASLRRVWYYSRLRRDAAKLAKVGDKSRCDHCGLLFDKIQIDHIDEVGSPKRDDGTYDWGRFIDRLLYCAPTNLARLCKQCHLSKGQVAREYRKLKKANK